MEQVGQRVLAVDPVGVGQQAVLGDERGLELVRCMWLAWFQPEPWVEQWC